MLKRIFPMLLLAAACLHPAMSQAQQTSQAASTLEEPKPKDVECKKPSYPSNALNKEEQGMVFIGFLVTATGSVEQTSILNSSGVTALDQRAMVALSKCHFQPALLDGKPAPMWVGVHYTWTLDGGEPELAAYIAEQAKGGSTRALYSLYKVLLGMGQDSAAQQILSLGANKGNASAQYQLGLQLSGRIPGFAMDKEKAKYWMGKAAITGHVLAKQELEVSPELFAPEGH